MIIARIPTQMLAEVLQLTPHLHCPYCKALFLGSLLFFAPEFACSSCGYRVGVEPQTGAVWQLEVAQFPQWEGPKAELVAL